MGFAWFGQVWALDLPGFFWNVLSMGCEKAGIGCAWAYMGMSDLHMGSARAGLEMAWVGHVLGCALPGMHVLARHVLGCVWAGLGMAWSWGGLVLGIW
jgi:hypothetical protein